MATSVRSSARSLSLAALYAMSDSSTNLRRDCTSRLARVAAVLALANGSSAVVRCSRNLSL